MVLRLSGRDGREKPRPPFQRDRQPVTVGVRCELNYIKEFREHWSHFTLRLSVRIFLKTGTGL